MRTHKSYIDTFRTIAATHVDIAHNPAENRFRFARIIDSARSLYEPYYHIQEVIELHQDKLETPCLLVESRVKEFEKSQQVHGMMTGAFIIMMKAERGDFDSEETALDDAERLVNHVMSYLKKLFMDDSSIGRLNWDNVRMNPVGPILDGFFGVRCDFSWQKSLNSDFCYDEQFWGDQPDPQPDCSLIELIQNTFTLPDLSDYKFAADQDCVAVQSIQNTFTPHPVVGYIQNSLA